MYWDDKHHSEFEISVKALVYDAEGKILVAKDESGKWDLPGGRIDEKESLEDCLRREVLEELGVSVKDITARPKFASILVYNDNKRRLIIGFSVELDSLEFKTSNENVENRFVSKDEFDLLEKVYAGLKNIKDKLYD